jgi:hypothetical protein
MQKLFQQVRDNSKPNKLLFIKRNPDQLFPLIKKTIIILETNRMVRTKRKKKEYQVIKIQINYSD